MLDARRAAMSPTDLERDVLQWFADELDDPALRQQLAAVTVTAREYTGAGFHVRLAVAEGVPSLPDHGGEILIPSMGISVLEPTFDDDGPRIESPELESGGSAVLWRGEAVVLRLELFGYGSHFPERLVEYSIR